MKDKTFGFLPGTDAPVNVIKIECREAQLSEQRTTIERLEREKLRLQGELLVGKAYEEMARRDFAQLEQDKLKLEGELRQQGKVIRDAIDWLDSGYPTTAAEILVAAITP